MSSRPLCAAAVLLVVAAACGGSSGEPLSQTERDSLRSADRQMQEGVLAGDWDAVAGHYAEDAYLDPPEATPVRGRDEIRNYFVSTLSAVDEFELEPLFVDGEGDLAYVRGRWSVTARVPEAGGDTSTVRDGGSYLVVRRRQDDGRWLIVQDIVQSSPRGAEATEEPPRSARP